LVSMLCMQQTDIKILIAYSSIAHIGFVIATLISGTPSGAIGALAVIIAHGVTSSGMFAGANLIYKSYNTRNLLVRPGLINLAPIFTILWFLIRLGNMGSPPTINLVAEICCIIAISPLSISLLLPIRIRCFCAAAYTLVLYSSTQHAQPSPLLLLSLPINKSAYLIMTTHLVWLIEGLILFIYSNLNITANSNYLYYCPINCLKQDYPN